MSELVLNVDAAVFSPTPAISTLPASSNSMHGEGGGGSGGENLQHVEELTEKIAAVSTEEEELPEAVNIGNTDDLRSGVQFTDPKLGMDETAYARIAPEVKERLKLISAAAVTRMNKEEMFSIQKESIPIMTAEPPHCLLAQAPGGAGKTVAFAMGLLARVDTKLNHTQG